MGRAPRISPGGYIFHVLNRANAGDPIFWNDRDYETFELILLEGMKHVPGMRLLSYCLMPNHWHLVLWPNAQGELSAFLHWLTLTHTQRWKAHYQQIGRGHLYQGRFKSFPIQEDEHLLTVCRYVEQNALRAGLADRAEVWQWGSLGHRKAGNSELAHHFTEWPVPRPVDWHEQVNTALTENELKTLRSCVNRGTPFGYSHWIASTAKQLGLESSLRNRGRPRKSIPNQEC